MTARHFNKRIMVRDISSTPVLFGFCGLRILYCDCGITFFQQICLLEESQSFGHFFPQFANNFRGARGNDWLSSNGRMWDGASRCVADYGYRYVITNLTTLFFVFIIVGLRALVSGVEKGCLGNNGYI